MERFIVKKRKALKKFDNQYQVIDTRSKEVISEHFYKTFAVNAANDLNLSDPNHPKHWLWLATTPNDIPASELFT